MADIRNITILPAQSISGTPQVQGSTGAGTQGTTALSGIAPGTVLSGFIVNRDASGNPILRTAGGDIAFSSNFFLNIGSEVEIRIENTGAGTLAHLLTVNGQPPEVAVTQSAFAQEPDVIVSQNLSAPQGQPQAATAATATAAEPEPATTLTVTGTLVAGPQQSSANTPPALPTGTQLTLKVTGLTNASPTNIPDEILSYSPTQPADNTQASNPAPANPAFYSTYARAAGATAPPAPSIPTVAPAAQAAQANTPDTLQSLAQAIIAPPPAAAGTAPAQPQAAQPQAPASAAPAAPQQNQAITATVISNDASQETHLQTQLGIIRLQPETVLPPGSTVTLEITDIATPAQTAAANNAASTMPSPLTELAQQWASLQQIVDVLSGHDAPTAFNFIQNAMPWVMPPPSAMAQNQNMPAQNIPAGLMLFMAALRGGNFSNWLGQDNVQWLHSEGHDDLLKKADSEFSLMARQFTEAAPSRWQPMFFPIAVAGELQQARLFVKRDRKQGSRSQQEKKNDDTRFVVEVDLTQLGEMQMDGFVRRRDKDVQFDLVIRSLTPLSSEIQDDILQIYNNTGELAGYKGSLAFQTVRDFPVNPMEELAGHTETVVV